jgi:hypothetical protein
LKECQTLLPQFRRGRAIRPCTDYWLSKGIGWEDQC